MTDSQQHQTTSCGSKGNRGRFSLDSPPPAAHVSSDPDIVGKHFGWVTVTSPEKRWNKSWNHCYVLTMCEGCGAVRWQLLDNLRRGLSKGCQECSQPRQIPIWLDRRLTAAKQRCTNPKNPAYQEYGARGIQFRFSSVTEAGLYLIQKYGLPERELEIDRIDTNGNYEPGNLRFVDRKTNCRNRRCTVLSEYDPKYWPYARSVVIRKLSEGLTREQIIQDAETAVFERRKNWRYIRARLAFMTYEMPESITVLPYRGDSSTTAATAALWEP